LIFGETINPTLVEVAGDLPHVELEVATVRDEARGVHVRSELPPVGMAFEQCEGDAVAFGERASAESVQVAFRIRKC
jgi:hypothetical protein